ncbi:glutathione synthetase [Nitrosophilus kaiyonis]|uniref:glutathione synthetase n=1 Tax=Nitrosophilus kaiyonis TaxID=2930200 RepID=UPI00249316BA|nr:glutathione synthetase [Nitrosophilus kaiyonis]
MKLVMILNDIYNEILPSSTIKMAFTATLLGHEVWISDVANFSYYPNETLHAFAVKAKGKNFKNPEKYYEHIVSEKSQKERILIDECDILMLRNDPAADFDKPWAQHSSLVFGRSAVRHGVIVLNDPDGLSKAINKMYFQQFPKIVRLKSLISKNPKEIREFYLENNKEIILKPLQGSAGRNVFYAGPNDENNLNQMINAISRDGYVIAEEFFPKALEGDVRLFLMNGKPLKVNGKYAAFKRVRSQGDIRSNIHAGGHAYKAEVTDKMLEIADIVRPKLVQDGMFLVGLDIVGDKLLEINVFSPGGLDNAQKFEGVNFAEAVIEALEKKVRYKNYYKKNFDNIELNTL